MANRNLVNLSRTSSSRSSSSDASGSGGTKNRYWESNMIRRPVKRTRIIQPTAQQLRVHAAIEADRIAAIAASQSQKKENQDLKRDIEVHPREIIFKLLGGEKSVIVYNLGNDICVFKIKCSDNDVYDVNPAFSYIEPRSTCILKVTRFNAADKIDYLTLVMGKVVDFTGNEEMDWEASVEQEDIIITLRALC